MQKEVLRTDYMKTAASGPEAQDNKKSAQTVCSGTQFAFNPTDGYTATNDFNFCDHFWRKSRCNPIIAINANLAARQMKDKSTAKLDS